MSESRETKASRVARRETNKKMLDELSVVIEAKITLYNELALDLGAEDVIMAFKMTKEEYAEAVKEALDEDSNEE